MPLAWSDGDFISSYKLNTSTYHRMTGLEMEALTSTETVNGMQVYCTQTSSVYTAGKHYRRALDNNSFEVVGLDSHTHTDDDSGGRLGETLIANLPVTFTLDKRFDKAASFYAAVASGGTVTDEAANARMLIQTSATNGGRAQISDAGSIKLNFAEPSAFESRAIMSSTTNFTCRLGIAAESIEAANDTTTKYGIEACSTTGSVWLVFSANGSVRSTTTTASNVTAGGLNRVDHVPATSVKLSVQGALVATKTTNVPATGVTPLNVLYRAGVKNSAAENKILYHYGGPIVVGSTAL